MAQVRVVFPQPLLVPASSTRGTVQDIIRSLLSPINKKQKPRQQRCRGRFSATKAPSSLFPAGRARLASRSSDLRRWRDFPHAASLPSRFPRWLAFANGRGRGVYSGGTVRDFHPVPYSPAGTKGSLGALAAYSAQDIVPFSPEFVNKCRLFYEKRKRLALSLRDRFTLGGGCGIIAASQAANGRLRFEKERRACYG